MSDEVLMTASVLRDETPQLYCVSRVIGEEPETPRLECTSCVWDSGGIELEVSPEAQLCLIPAPFPMGGGDMIVVGGMLFAENDDMVVLNDIVVFAGDDLLVVSDVVPLEGFDLLILDPIAPIRYDVGFDVSCNPRWTTGADLDARMGKRCDIASILLSGCSSWSTDTILSASMSGIAALGLSCTPAWISNDTIVSAHLNRPFLDLSAYPTSCTELVVRCVPKGSVANLQLWMTVAGNIELVVTGRFAGEIGPSLVATPRRESVADVELSIEVVS